MIDFLQHHATLLLFVSICVGYLIGGVRVKTFRLGGVCGTLLVALVIGQAHVVVAPGASQVASALFIFSLGYLAGPQFVASFRRQDLRLLLFPLIELVTAAIAVIVSCLLFKLPPGAAAGLFAGATTQSAALGTASEALDRIGLSSTDVAVQQADLAAVYSMCYLCGLVTIVVFSTQIGPAVMRVDLADDAAALVDQLRRSRSNHTDASHAAVESSADTMPDLVGRAYVAGPDAPRTLGCLEAQLGGRVLASGVLRNNTLITRAPELTLQATDVVQLVGRREGLSGAAHLLGPEQPIPAVMNHSIVTAEVMVTRASLRRLGERLEDLSGHSPDLVVTDVQRSGESLPALPGLTLSPGDVITVFGSPAALRRSTPGFGQVIDRNVHADFAYLAAGLIVGMTIGLLNLRFGVFDLTIGTGGGVLLAGLFFGWLRTKRSAIGAYAPQAAEVVKDLGLTIFIGVTGLTAAPQLLGVLERFGLVLPIAAILITIVPAAVSLLVARRVFRLPSPLALGAVAGQQCSSPALTALLHRAGNSTPLISYVTVYALSNVLLPLAAPLIVGAAASIGGR